jgi:hypothetical protein
MGPRRVLDTKTYWLIVSRDVTWTWTKKPYSAVSREYTGISENGGSKWSGTKNKEHRKSSCEDVKCDWKTSCVIFGVKVKVTLRLTVSQSVSLGIETHLGLMTRYLLLFSSYGLDFVGRPIWREDGFTFCIWCWPLPVHSFSGLSPLGLATVFYCLRFETSHFVASYDSQGHGRGIRPRLHTGKSGGNMFILSLHILGADPKEYTASSNSSIVVMGCCLAIYLISFRGNVVTGLLLGRERLFIRSFHSTDCTRCPF